MNVADNGIIAVLFQTTCNACIVGIKRNLQRESVAVLADFAAPLYVVNQEEAVVHPFHDADKAVFELYAVCVRFGQSENVALVDFVALAVLVCRELPDRFRLDAVVAPVGQDKQVPDLVLV